MLDLSPEEYSLLLTILSYELHDELNPAISKVKALHRKINDSFKEIYPLDFEHHEIIQGIISGALSKEDAKLKMEKIKNTLLKGAGINPNDIDN